MTVFEVSQTIRFWQQGKDTYEIAQILRVSESDCEARVYDYLRKKKGRAMTSKPVTGIQIKDGKVKIKPHYRDASHAIRCKTSKNQRVVRRKPA